MGQYKSRQCIDCSQIRTLQQTYEFKMTTPKNSEPYNPQEKFDFSELDQKIKQAHQMVQDIEVFEQADSSDTSTIKIDSSDSELSESSIGTVQFQLLELQLEKQRIEETIQQLESKESKMKEKMRERVSGDQQQTSPHLSTQKTKLKFRLPAEYFDSKLSQLTMDYSQSVLPNFHPPVQVLNLNKLAMDSLRQGDIKAAQTYLAKAQRLTDTNQQANTPKLKAVTLNNIGCFYKKVNDIDSALAHFKAALRIQEAASLDIVQQAGTLLNICSMQSMKGRHHKALYYANRALKLLTSNFQETDDLVQTLIIAYHNAGVELQLLEDFKQAKGYFRKGWEIGSDKLGIQHPLTKALKDSYQAKQSNKGSAKFPESTSQRIVVQNRQFRPKPSEQTKNLANRHRNGCCGHNHSTEEEKPRRKRRVFNETSFINRSLTVNKPQPRLLPRQIPKKYYTPPKVIKSVKQPELYPIKKPEKIAIRRLPSAAKSQRFTPERRRPDVPPQKQRAVNIIQSLFRAFLAKKMIDVEALRHKADQHKQVQAGKKGKNTGIQTSQMKLPQSKPKKHNFYHDIVKIQARIRAFIQRRRFLRTKAAAITIQKNIRRHQVWSLYLLIKEAIVFIQATWRGVRARRRLAYRKQQNNIFSILKLKINGVKFARQRVRFNRIRVYYSYGGESQPPSNGMPA